MAKRPARRAVTRSVGVRKLSRGSGRGRASGSRGGRGAVILVSAVAVVLVALVAYVGVYLVTPHRGRGGVLRVSLPEPPTSEGVARALYRAGAIDRPWLFAWLITVMGVEDQLPHGVVMLRDDLTPRAVLRALVSGGGVVRVTIPEGSNRFEIARRLAGAGVVDSPEAFVARTQDPVVVARYGVRGDSLEGYLFPDTYDFVLGGRVDDVIDKMVRTFRRRMRELRSRHPEGMSRAERLGLDERAIVILASMVEKETGSDEDRPRIAAVFLNRLTVPTFQPRLLQSDPTVVYGCFVARPPSCAHVELGGRVVITRAMLEDAANPYNTYRHPGLPPGPITNPGVRSLEAVLAPADSGDLYFVSMGNGRSAFASTLAEHQANVQRYLRDGRGRVRDGGSEQ